MLYPEKIGLHCPVVKLCLSFIFYLRIYLRFGFLGHWSRAYLNLRCEIILAGSRSTIGEAFTFSLSSLFYIRHSLKEFTELNLVDAVKSSSYPVLHPRFSGLPLMALAKSSADISFRLSSI